MLTDLKNMVDYESHKNIYFMQILRFLQKKTAPAVKTVIILSNTKVY